MSKRPWVLLSFLLTLVTLLPTRLAAQAGWSDTASVARASGTEAAITPVEDIADAERKLVPSNEESLRPEVLGVNGLSFVGNVGYQVSGTSVNLRADRVENTHTTRTSGSLRLALWMSTGGYRATGYRTATYQFTSVLQPREYFFDVSRTVPWTTPPTGCYYASMLLEEFQSNGTWTYMDYVDFSNRASIGGGCSTTPPPPPPPPPTPPPPPPPPPPTGNCTNAGSTICLSNNRFAVQVSWRTSDNRTGMGVPVRYSADSALFWFFGADNAEVLLKVLNACGFNNRIWVFGASATDVEYNITVTDTRTGVVKNYFKPLGVPAPAITDSGAFSTCP